MIYSYFVNIPNAQQQYYSDQDVLDVFSNVNVNSLKNADVYQGWFGPDYVTEDEGNMLISEYICNVLYDLGDYDPTPDDPGDPYYQQARSLFENLLPTQYEIKATCSNLDGSNPIIVYDSTENTNYEFLISRQLLVRDAVDGSPTENTFNKILRLEVALRS